LGEGLEETEGKTMRYQNINVNAIDTPDKALDLYDAVELSPENYTNPAAFYMGEYCELTAGAKRKLKAISRRYDALYTQWEANK